MKIGNVEWGWFMGFLEVRRFFFFVVVEGVREGRRKKAVRVFGVAFCSLRLGWLFLYPLIENFLFSLPLFFFVLA